jgi:hypothetical protein
MSTSTSTSTNKAPGQAGAPGKQARIDALDASFYEASHRLLMMGEIVKLARFAAEARRTLDGISLVQQAYPEVDATIREHVDTAYEWDQCPDALGGVLGFASAEMEDAQQAMERAFMALKREASTGSPLNGGAQ